MDLGNGRVITSTWNYEMVFFMHVIFSTVVKQESGSIELIEVSPLTNVYNKQKTIDCYH